MPCAQRGGGFRNETHHIAVLQSVLVHRIWTELANVEADEEFTMDVRTGKATEVDSRPDRV